MNGFVIVLAFTLALTLFLLFSGLNHRVLQEQRICAQIQGADCSFLYTADDPRSRSRE